MTPKLFIDFADDIDRYDQSLFQKEIDYQDVLEWWNMADDFTLSIFNDLCAPVSPYQCFKDYNGKYIASVQIGLEKTKTGYLVGFRYNAATRPPYKPDQPIMICFTPLKPDYSIIYAEYSRLWYTSPNPEDWKSTPIQSMGTFRVLGKNIENNKYQIIAMNENTNFFHKYVLPGKFRHDRLPPNPPYMWGGILIPGTVKSTAHGITFDLEYSLCPNRAPCYHDLTVTYIYQNRKLSATKYHEYDERHGYDPKTGKYIPKDVTVNLAP